ncbi:MAG: triose-phosphate isomerase [Actinomycetota bacterium]|nr:triose-phosphate isomerase [Actinomycetota bacterium]
MSERRPYLAANWKMQKTVEETEEFLDRFLGDIGDLADTDIVICPPFTSLAAAVERCRRSPVGVAAQNMHDADSGAYTGEISASMLTSLGVEAVILGHSERRALFAEADEALARKLVAALRAKLEPILCVGESEIEREEGLTEDVLRRQLEADLAQVEDSQLAGVVIAYEPVWAIGTGKTASPEQASDAVGFVRSVVAERSDEAAAQIRILYGGSVKPDNAEELLRSEEIDGALVGGASLEPADFLAICEAA